MASILTERYRINGVLSADKTVMQNLDSLCAAAGTWLTFDIHTGRWSVIINEAGESVKSFDDNNIIGSINISGTGIFELYNSVRVEFPHVDLNDERDWIAIEIPDEDRNPSEFDQELTLRFDILNNPVQAEMIGLMALKQSRVDKIIQFRTDFTAMGLKAGDLIDITSDIYGYDQKVFRIVSISEDDGDDNSIQLSITALEYDPNVYDFSDLNRYTRTNADGIIDAGAIGKPATPQVTMFETDSRPRILVEGIVPTGRVEGLEFWYYPMTNDEAGAWEGVDDETRTYILHSTLRPTSSGQNLFETNEEVNLNIVDFDKGNYLFKIRGVNATTSGPFSDFSGLIEYIPVQTPDAITDETDLLDEFGLSLLGLLGLPALLALLKGLLEDGNTGPGSMFDQIWGLTRGKGVPIYSSGTLTVSASTCNSFFNGYVGDTPWGGTAGGTPEGFAGNPASQISLPFTIPEEQKDVIIFVKSPVGTFDFKTNVGAQFTSVFSNGGTRTETGIVTRSNFYAYIPCQIELFYFTTRVQIGTVDWQTGMTTIQLPVMPPGNYTFLIKPLPTYDLNQTGSYYIYPENINVVPNFLGDGMTITFIGFN